MCGSRKPVRYWLRRLPTAATIAIGLLLAHCSALRPTGADPVATARALLRSGDYAAARRGFEAALKASGGQEEAEAGLLAALRITGAYAQAQALAEQFSNQATPRPAAELERGRVAVLRGEYGNGEKFLSRAVDLGGTVRPAALRELGDLLETLGRREEAARIWNRLLDDYVAGRLRPGDQTGAAAVAAWRLGRVRDARDLFVDATSGKAAETASADTFVDFGNLFLDKYDLTNALSAFRDALKINKACPGALLGVAVAKKQENDVESEQYAKAALEVNPSLVGAMALLAELRLQEEDYQAARKVIDRALAVNPVSLEALTMEAMCQRFQGDVAAFVVAEKKILAINPRDGDFYHDVALGLVARRKYRESVEFSRKAVALRPDLWPAYASLGMNLMRLGDLAEGRRFLQRAFDGDPYNVWAYNTLDLLDQMDKFGRSRGENFVYLMSAEDLPVLSPLSSALAEEAWRTLSTRYGFVPSGPIQVEIFPDHGGFAVRTLGEPGLGALGVCFGTVVAMDSPRARKAGHFNWGSTLWHELAHVISLQMSDHNVPRWYSEGISVYEEHRARPGWGDDLTAQFVKAYVDGRLLKVSQLNSGMMRPRFPEQIAMSYYQAALVCQLIEERFGFAKIPETLRLFAAGKTTSEVFRATLGWDSDRLDAEYDQYLSQRLKPLVARLDFKRLENETEKGNRPDADALRRLLDRNPDDFYANLELGRLMRTAKNNREAERYLKKAQGLFPEFVEQGNPYQLLSDIYLEDKREAEALEELLAWTRYDEDTAAPLVRAAEILRGRREWARAVEVLEKSVYIQPYDAGAQAALSECSMEAGRWDHAVDSARAVVALHPTDPARAHYNLARALLGAGNRQEARREVLRALEIAPTFEEAQALLLKLRGGQS